MIQFFAVQIVIVFCFAPEPKRAKLFIIKIENKLRIHIYRVVRGRAKAVRNKIH